MIHPNLIYLFGTIGILVGLMLAMDLYQSRKGRKKP